MPVCRTASRTRSASYPMMAYTSLAPTTLAAAPITCSSSGLPPTSCNSLGIRDFSLVPLPAAMIAIAILGALERFGVETNLAEAEDFALDFFIRTQYTLSPQRWLFQESCPTILRRLRYEALPSNGGNMPKYVIERDIPKIGDVTPDQV